MAHRDSAASLLEFLTYPNPTITHVKRKSSTNTKSDNYYYPKEIKRWDGFNDYTILRSAFRGRLYQNAVRQLASTWPYPFCDPLTDGTVCNEDETRDVFLIWNCSIVKQALREVDDFRPSYWVTNTQHAASTSISQLPLSPNSLLDSPQGVRRQPSRSRASVTVKSRKRSRPRRIPDAGAAVLDRETPIPSLDRTAGERFPKEYKPAEKWSSERSMEERLLDQGCNVVRWSRSDARHEQAWPIRQAYTYCVDKMCRYGCILTCKEAFIFRVQPLDKQPANGEHDTLQLQRSLILNGKMEYVSIPWENHTQRDEKVPERWTVNLAMWFFHVLAGHHHEVAWDYDSEEYNVLGDWLVAQSEAKEAAEGTPSQDTGETSAGVAVGGGAGSEDVINEPEAHGSEPDLEEENVDFIVLESDQTTTDSDEDGSRAFDEAPQQRSPSMPGNKAGNAVLRASRSDEHPPESDEDGSRRALEESPQRLREQPVTPSNKRPWNSDLEDGEAEEGYSLSFSKRTFRGP